MQKLISLLLEMVLIFSLLPLSAVADTIEEKIYGKDTDTGKWHELVNDQPYPALTDKDLIASLDKSWNEYMAELENQSLPVCAVFLQLHILFSKILKITLDFSVIRGIMQMFC